VSLPGTFLPTRAGRLFIHRSGRGSPLLLIHGWLMSHYYFRNIIPALAADREIIALDLPGFGESDRPAPEAFAYDLPAFADVVDEVMTALDIPRADILGASMGGGTALTLAARRPERVQRLILVSAAVFPPPRLPLEARLALAPGGQFLFKHVFGRREFARGARDLSVRDPSCIDADWVDYFWARFNRAGAREASYACLKMLCTLSPNNGDPGRVRAPTLIAWGDEDRMVPLAMGKRLQRAIAGARLEVIPACGHMPHVERPEALVRAVRPFLAEPATALPETPIPPRRSQSIVGS
jgi:pimeloyl-ACP methyl ester carboxylesterase